MRSLLHVATITLAFLTAFLTAAPTGTSQNPEAPKGEPEKEPIDNKYFRKLAMEGCRRSEC